jgi:hypothetical protein
MPQPTTWFSKMRRFTALSSTMSTRTPASAAEPVRAGLRFGESKHRGELKRAASPGSLWSVIRPPISFTSVDTMASPSRCRRTARRRAVCLAEGIEDRLVLFGWDSDSVSVTENRSTTSRSLRASGWTPTSTCPRSVNFSALPTRFVRICFNRPGRRRVHPAPPPRDRR